MRRFQFILLAIIILPAFIGCSKKDPVEPPVVPPALEFIRYDVYSDDNNDQIPNRGETVEIHIYVINNGAGAATQVGAFLTEDSPHIAVTYNQPAFGTINPGLEEQGACILEISDLCPYDYEFPCYLNIYDGEGRTWADTFSISVEKTSADLRYSKNEVWFDTMGDGIPNRGEEVRINLYLENVGSSAAWGVEADLTENDPYIILTDSYGLYTRSLSDFFDPLEEKHDSFIFEVSETCPYGHVATFYIEITDDYNNVWQDTFNVTVQQTAADVEYSKNEVFYDDNGDGIPSRGETVGINLFLENIGTSATYGVEANVTEFDPYINLTDSYGNYPRYFNPDDERSSPVVFDISNACPYGHVVTFNVDITDDFSNTWQDQFTVTIVQTEANIVFDRFDINADDNSDGRVNPGENIKMLVYVENTGSSKALGVAANLIEADIYVTMTNSYEYYGDLEAGVSQVGIYYFTVSEFCPVPHTINFDLDINDLEDNEWLDIFNVTVQ